MFIVETLTPIILLIALGAGLAHIRFLGEPFMADLNKLAFWVALPALLFVSASHKSEPGDQTWRLFGVVLAGTILITLIAWGVSRLMKMPASTHGTLMQSAFRGNLFYIAVPVLTYSQVAFPEGKRKQILASAVIVMILIMACYNILAVIVLQSGRHSNPGFFSFMKSVGTNPLLLAGLLGLVMPLMEITLPSSVRIALDSLGAAAIPLSLLCIGGAVTLTPLTGRRTWIVTAALLKVAILPLLIYFLGWIAGLGAIEQRISLIIGACPTAGVSFVMAKEMGGDAVLASGSIALSTILSAASLAAVLWLTS